MGTDLERIRSMAYPGRIIIIGTSLTGQRVVLYAITGRSPSSQARRLEIDTARSRVFVRPTDEETLKTGNPDLLVYPAIICGTGIAVSNGTQTEAVFSSLSAQAAAVDVLCACLPAWEYEPDAPNFTPRISGCITRGAALSIIKRAADGSAVRSYFEVPLIPGTGKMIATYTGANENPLPSFTGEPQEVGIPWSNPADAAQAVYEALGPKPGSPDFRVAAAAVFAGAEISMQVKNRHS
jgi:IMP cyclohydrolase